MIYNSVLKSVLFLVKTASYLSRLLRVEKENDTILSTQIVHLLVFDFGAEGNNIMWQHDTHLQMIHRVIKFVDYSAVCLYRTSVKYFRLRREIPFVKGVVKL